jgi:PIN domain nuclease of toxin-antitoxin system
VRLLLDTHLLLWAASEPAAVPVGAAELILDRRNELWYSVASLWEIAIKSGLGRSDFAVDARILRSGLRAARYRELPVDAEHVLPVASLPPHHADPFDRLLVAQAAVEGMTLLTHDLAVASYGVPVRYV